MRNLNHLSRIAGLAAAAALTVSAFASDAQAWTETVLHSFAGGSDGAGPAGNLIADQNGNLFGTTVIGGSSGCHRRGCGTVFKIGSDGTETVLYAFQGRDDGKNPNGGLLLDDAGNLYGTTFGDSSTDGGGTIFELSPSGVHTVLYTFTAGGTDGYAPQAGLIADQAGNLYGTTEAGGGSSCECGTVFEFSTGGGYTVLYSFQGGSDGGFPRAPVVFDAAGNLYGTTASGGIRCDGSGCGAVFELAPNGTETLPYAFRGERDGADPIAGLIFDSSGNLYGTTVRGGGTGCGGTGCGTVFELAPGGTETVLSRFNQIDGPSLPQQVALIREDNGDLFGTTSGGGAGKCGAAFKLAPGHGAKAIYSFKCGKDGSDPQAGLVIGSNGDFYGTTLAGGDSGNGTVFALHN